MISYYHLRVFSHIGLIEPLQNKRWLAIFMLILAGFAFGCDEGKTETRPKQEFLFMPKGSPPASVIDVVDLRGKDIDTKLAAITLQGHINSGELSEVCLLLWREEENDNTSSSFWLEWFKRKGYIRDTRSLSLEQYFHKYAEHYDKVIVYDPNLPATINIATMIGSVENGIVVAPRDVQRFGRGKLIENLGGRWKNNISAYEWAFDNLWPRMNHRILSCQHPTFADHHLRDYLVRHKVFQFWVTGKNVEDNKISDYETELAFAEKLFKMTHPNTPLVGWVGTDENDDGLTEYHGVELASRYGHFTVGSNWGVNLSLMSGITIDIEQMVSSYHNRVKHNCPKLQCDKVYLSFVIQESGDSPIYWKSVQKRIWDDPKRGQIPIAWTLGLSVFEMNPAILEWFYENATENDHFYIGMSGTGYTHPYRNFLESTPAPEKAWKQYLGIIQRYIDLTQMRHMAVYTDAWIPFDREKNDPITLRFADGLKGLSMLIMGMGRDEGIVESGHNYLIGKNNVLVSHVVTRWDAANIGRSAKNNKWLTDEIIRNTPAERPAFITVHALSWSYYPSDLVSVLAELGDEYVAVSLDDYRNLYLSSNDGCIEPEHSRKQVSR